MYIFHVIKTYTAAELAIIMTYVKVIILLLYYVHNIRPLLSLCS